LFHKDTSNAKNTQIVNMKFIDTDSKSYTTRASKQIRSKVESFLSWFHIMTTEKHNQHTKL